jgi:aminopeptidase-like protein
MYEEYHTSLDDLINVVTPAGLEGGYNLIKKIVEALENNRYPKVKVLCEPQLSKYGLYPTISNLSSKDSQEEIILLLNFISCSDGSKSLIEIAELCECPVWKLYPILEKLIEKNLITVSDK